MKNYVVWHNCEITNDRDQFGIASASRPGVRGDYNRMHEISLASARHFLAGTWEPIVFTDPEKSRVEMFKNSWHRICELWMTQDCNILYLDSDTVFVKPTEIFGVMPGFRLFNWTTPKNQHGFENYFNAGVRYYPRSMSMDVWGLGSDLAWNWNLDIWDQEQQIFNKMFWSQDLDWHDAHRPQLNWQAPTGDFDNIAQHSGFNDCEYRYAQIIHYHGTRSSDRGQRLAEQLARSAGVPL